MATPILVAAALLLGGPARGQTCYNQITRTTYPSGFAVADFSTMTNTQITSAAVALTANSTTGSVVSNNVSTEIPSADIDNTVISKVHVIWTATYSKNNCSVVMTLSLSVDDGVNWRVVSTTPGEFNFDTLRGGLVGSNLRWKVDIVDNDNQCNGTLTDVDIGYQALRAGEFQFSEPSPIANMNYRSTFETPSSTWTGGDRTPRGHLRAYSLYDADTLTNGLVTRWDAGAVLAAKAPIDRKIYFSNNGVTTALSSASDTLILPTAVRTAKFASNALVYDLNADGVVDAADATVVTQWALGYESGTTQRAWKLGGIFNSSPVVVPPPQPNPWWLAGSATPAAERTAYTTTYATANVARPTRIVVGARDGMVHAFNGGSFQFGDDAGTTFLETRGYFAKSNGVRDYGDGDEVWAFVPSNQLSMLKNNLPAVSSYLPESNPRAAVNGGINVADVTLSSGAATVIVAAQGKNHLYVDAIDVSTDSPKELWSWTDTDFHGTYAPPSIGPMTTPAGRVFVTATTSGVADTAGDVYLYVIDLNTGVTLKNGNQTIGKVKLNSGSGNNAVVALGTVGSPVMIDSDGDGMVDRVYVVDTSGRLYKVITADMTACEIAAAGELVFSPMTVEVGTNPPQVKIFFGGADNPDLIDPLAIRHLFAFVDTETGSDCSTATQLFSVTLPQGHKVWTAPTTGGGNVYFATSTTNRLDPCDDLTTPGLVYGLSTTPDGNGQAIQLWAPVNVASDVGAVRSYDGHLFINTIGGTTTLLGAPTWNNNTTSGGNNTGKGGVEKASPLPTTLWYQQ